MNKKKIYVMFKTNFTQHCQFVSCRKKYTIRLQEQEEHIETLIVKINNLEKQKSRLQSEVEVLIIDLEKVVIIIVSRTCAFIFIY